jgi:hypothetical protein
MATTSSSLVARGYVAFRAELSKIRREMIGIGHVQPTALKTALLRNGLTQAVGRLKTFRCENQKLMTMMKADN